MLEVVTWGAIIAASGSLVALIKLWIDIGKVWQQAEDAKSQVSALNAKLDLLTTNISEYKLSVAKEYATNDSLREAEQALVRNFEKSFEGLYQRLDAMTGRLDNVIAIANRKSD